MIKLNRWDDGKQYLCINITDGTMAADVYRILADVYPVLAESLRGLDNQQILVEICEDVYYGFSLRDLASNASAVCKATIYTFAVEEDEFGQYTQAYKHLVGSY